MSLRTRLLLLVVLATLVPAILVGLRFFQNRTSEIEAAVVKLSATANNISNDLDEKIQGTAQLHYGLARARDLDTDILVTTGGASVGDYDFVNRAFAAEGMVPSFWKIAMRPGRPLMHGRLGAMAVLGVPGNPVSSYVCAFLFLVPLIRKLTGRDDLVIPSETATLGSDLPENDERADYLRALLKDGPDGPVATPFPTQDSSMMAPLAQAGCLVIRQPHAAAAKAGSRCEMVRLDR